MATVIMETPTDRLMATSTRKRKKVRKPKEKEMGRSRTGPTERKRRARNQILRVKMKRKTILRILRMTKEESMTRIRRPRNPMQREAIRREARAKVP